MYPNRLSFLTKFDKFYQELVSNIKEAIYAEQEFYTIIIAKAKAMNRERRDQKKEFERRS